MGSNVGDRLAHLRDAVRRLAADPLCKPIASSRVYETAPVGPPGQGPYLNAVLWLQARCEAHDLLARLLAIEVACGRVRNGRDEVRWGPRALDLDILLYADQCLCSPGLEVPHPRLAERAFVLEPLCDLVPERRHPKVGRTFHELAGEVRDPVSVRVFGAPLWPQVPARSAGEGRDGDRRGQHLTGR